MNEVLRSIRNETAEFIGQGPWVKGGCFQVWKYNNKFYSIMLVDEQNCWMEDDTLTEIKESEVVSYI